MTSIIDRVTDVAAEGLLELLGGKAKLKGKYGEWQARNELRLVKIFGRKGKILKNIYIPKLTSEDEGQYTEIDSLFITQKGIFVLECKNYGGWIFGNEDDYRWTQSFPSGEKFRFYNPILQNRGHIRYLSEYLKEDKYIPFFSIISFLEKRSELKKISVHSPDVFVITSDRIYATVRKVWKDKSDILDENKVEELYDKLNKLTNVDKAIEASHIKNVDYYKKTAYKNIKSSEQSLKSHIEVQNNSEQGMHLIDLERVCPRCGGKLVLRTAKRGAYAGKQFYGCCNFPKCRYIAND